MKKSTAIFWLLVAVVTLFVGNRLYSLYQDITSENKRLHEDLVSKTEAYEQLSDKAAKLENQYVEQKQLKEKLEKEFQEEKSALNGRIKMLSNATFLIREKARKTGKSDFTYQGKMFKYILNELRFNDGPPLGYVLIFDDGRVVSKIYKHEINVKTAVSRDEDSGKYSVVSKADFILKSPSLNVNGEKVWLNKPYALSISGGTAVIDPTEHNQLRRRFHLWAPHLNAKVDFASTEPSPGLGLSVAGYGKTKNDLDFRFLQIGFHYDNEAGIRSTLTPVLWRPFNSLLSNTYLGPGIAIDSVGLRYFLGVQIGL